MTLKKNIISTNCPTGPREILNNGKFGFLCEVENYKQISNKILYYKSENKYVLKNIANIGFKNLDRFDYDLNLNKYLHEIKRLY